MMANFIASTSVAVGPFQPFVKVLALNFVRDIGSIMIGFVSFYIYFRHVNYALVYL